MSENLRRAFLCPLDTTMFPTLNGRQKKARSIISYVTRGENDLIFFSFFRCSAYVGKRRRKWLRRTIRATCFKTRILKFRTAGILLPIWETQKYYFKNIILPFFESGGGTAVCRFFSTLLMKSAIFALCSQCVKSASLRQNFSPPLLGRQVVAKDRIKTTLLRNSSRLLPSSSSFRVR